MKVLNHTLIMMFRRSRSAWVPNRQDSNKNLIFLCFIFVGNYALLEWMESVKFVDDNGFIGNFLTILVGIMCLGMGKIKSRPVHIVGLAVLAYAIDTTAVYFLNSIRKFGNHLYGMHLTVTVLPHHDELSYSSIATKLAGGPIYFLLAICISAPLWEELVRGVAYKAMRRWFGMWPSFWVAIIPSLLTHRELPYFTFTFHFVMGILVINGFSWIERSIIHSIVNIITLANILGAEIFIMNVESRGEVVYFLLSILAFALCVSFFVLMLRQSEGGEMMQ